MALKQNKQLMHQTLQTLKHTLCFSVLLAMFTALPSFGRENIMPEKNQMNSYRSLGHIGIKFDCYFTIESTSQSNLYPFNLPIDVGSKVSNLKSLSGELSRTFPDFNFIPDDKGLPVIHIIDKKLSMMINYALNDKESINYSGVLSLLPNKIRDINKGVSPPFVFTGSIISLDNSTKVTFSAVNESVRYIMSAYIPFSKYMRKNRVIYQSEYMDPVNSVYFKGKSDLDVAGEYDWAKKNRNSSGIIPFDDGEAAYVLNSYTKESQSSALKYISDHVESVNSTQVRWAMLFLGAHKSERAISMLIQHLDYQYAPVPVIEERYPALRALTAIGLPTSRAVLERLQVETDSKRLELLCRVVLQILGVDKGKQAVEASVATILSSSRRGVVLESLSKALKPGNTSDVILLK